MSTKPEHYQASNHYQGKILIVDDTLENLELLSRMLTRRGYEIQAVTSGEMALSAIAASPPDMILLDICMPQMDGYELCQSLKANVQTNHIPVIFISALDQVISKLRAFDAGGVDYITKPFRVPEVMARVTIHMTLRRLQQQLHEQNELLKQQVSDRLVAEAALQLANQELQRLAHLDGLTQVANRRRFDEYLEQEWSRLTREQLPLSLIFCDVDCFKAYNDTYGHLAGDDCLRHIARVLQISAKRPADVVARYGGEEFAVILPNTPSAGAIQVAEEMRLGVKRLEVEHMGSQVASIVTLSLGVATIVPPLNLTSDALIAAADRALYRAKAEGRDRTINEYIETENKLPLK